MIYPITPEVLQHARIKFDEYEVETPWCAAYLKDGYNHYFGAIIWEKRFVRVEVLNTWKREDGGDNVYVKSLDGPVFGRYASPGARANGGTPITFGDTAVVGVDTHQFVPIAKVVDGEYIPLLLADTKLPMFERAEHRQEIEQEFEAAYYLQNLADEHGNEWPKKALERLLQLHGDHTWAHYSDLAEEYNALLAWAEETIEAGIAFKQSQYLEA